MVRALLENSRWLYTALVGLVALGRGLELLIARRNYRWLPLIHSAWLAAAFFSLSNGAILRVRMRVEEAALRRYGSGSRRTS